MCFSLDQSNKGQIAEFREAEREYNEYIKEHPEKERATCDANLQVSTQEGMGNRQRRARRAALKSP
jgi:hypothetical protein